jgi:hypothetical protein
MIKATLISYLEPLDLANARGSANVRRYNPVGGALETVVGPIRLDIHDPIKGEHKVVRWHVISIGIQQQNLHNEHIMETCVCGGGGESMNEFPKVYFLKSILKENLPEISLKSILKENLPQGLTCTTSLGFMYMPPVSLRSSLRLR